VATSPAATNREALDLVAEAVDQDPDELAAYCLRKMLRCEADEDLRDLAEMTLSSTSQVQELLNKG